MTYLIRLLTNIFQMWGFLLKTQAQMFSIFNKTAEANAWGGDTIVGATGHEMIALVDQEREPIGLEVSHQKQTSVAKTEGH